MEMSLGKYNLEIEPSDDKCSLCGMPDGYTWSFKKLFLLAYKKAFRNMEQKPEKSDAYEYVLNFIDIDVSEDNILCEDCIERIFDQVVEALQDYED